MREISRVTVTFLSLSFLSFSLVCIVWLLNLAKFNRECNVDLPFLKPSWELLAWNFKIMCLYFVSSFPRGGEEQVKTSLFSKKTTEMISLWSRCEDRRDDLYSKKFSCECPSLQFTSSNTNSVVDIRKINKHHENTNNSAWSQVGNFETSTFRLFQSTRKVPPFRSTALFLKAFPWATFRQYGRHTGTLWKKRKWFHLGRLSFRPISISVPETAAPRDCPL